MSAYFSLSKYLEHSANLRYLFFLLLYVYLLLEIEYVFGNYMNF